MNSNYVQKFTDYLQNIPAHKTSKPVVDQTSTSSSVVAMQPQSKPLMNKPSSKKISGKNGQPGPAVVGGVGIRRPVWVVPSAASSQLPHQPADERKFVRTCCPSRRAESVRPLRRVDCRWAEGDKPQTPLIASVPKGDVIPVEKCPDTPEPKELSLGHGDGLGDNVNHQHNPALASEDLTAGDGHDKSGQKRTPEEFWDRQPSSWAGMLSKAHPLPSVSDSVSLRGSDIRISFPDEHRPLYKIGKELSDVVKILTRQQLEPSKINIPALHPKTGPAVECENCSVLQRNLQSEMDRHALESSQHHEAINNLKLDLANKIKATDAMTAQYGRLEEQFAKLRDDVEAKQTLELEVMEELRRKVKEARCRQQQLEQERNSAEARLMEALMDNERMEFLLHTQDSNFSRVKSELSTIHKLSAKQLEFLDDPGNDGRVLSAVGNQRHRRQASAKQRVECNITPTSTSLSSRPPSDALSPANLHSATSLRQRLVIETEQRNGKPCSKGSSGPEKPAITPEPDSIPTESMPSLAPSLSDQDNSSHARRSTARRRISTSSDVGSSGLGRLSGLATSHDALACARGPRDNECEDHRSSRATTTTTPTPVINGGHDDNRNCQLRARPFTSCYSTGHRKFGRAEKRSPGGTFEGHRAGDSETMKWQNDDKNHGPASPASFLTCDGSPDDSSRENAAADYERGKKMDGPASHYVVRSRAASLGGDQPASPVTLDDHQQFVAELAENITLPPSPVPYRGNVSTGSQLSDNDEPGRRGESTEPSR
ncbi:uncharacterized protein LOC131294695 [Anopheles ziemanni]|uniref:uncharacterized protein LOC131294695 n=1 Tax=Anopheles ziemanni TaxID=345580 RepID=UPI00265E4A64|nr:uncharacterized protein LOC131294695 [Anopheles ziemanni]